MLALQEPQIQVSKGNLELPIFLLLFKLWGYILFTMLSVESMLTLTQDHSIPPLEGWDYKHMSTYRFGFCRSDIVSIQLRGNTVVFSQVRILVLSHWSLANVDMG